VVIEAIIPNSLNVHQPMNKIWQWAMEYYSVIKNKADQWKRIDRSEINPCVYGQMIFNEDASG
jgi:hypothetical protein